MLDVQTSCGEIFNVSLILGRSGAMANQIKKAVKNPIHEQCKARIWGRLKDRSLISVALSSWSGSTFYIDYVPEVYLGMAGASKQSLKAMVQEDVRW